MTWAGLHVLVAAALLSTPVDATRVSHAVAKGLDKQQELQSAVSNCAEILQDGIRNRLRNDLNVATNFEADEKLKKFDEDYSYDQYKQDQRAASASSSSQSSNTAVSASYWLISVGVSHGQSKSQSMMDENEFSTQKKSAIAKKRALETSSHKAGSMSKDLEYASELVSSEITQAWKDCVRFAHSQIETHIDKEITGRALSISLKYTLGAGPEWKIQPKIVQIEVTPQRAATCRVTNGEGQPVKSMPIEFHVGVPVHISCQRSDDNMDKVSVFVATNVVKEGMRAYFEDIVTTVVAEDVVSLKTDLDVLNQRVDKKLGDTIRQSKEFTSSKIGDTIRQSKEFTSSKINELRNTVHRDIRETKSLAASASSQVKELRHKLNAGACRLCRTCGSGFNKNLGSISSTGSIYGAGCAEPQKNFFEFCEFDFCELWGDFCEFCEY